ncbi:hypothetical protein KKA00_05135, partial [bacterium]|nr:hypothetical protein [bacterium]
MRDSKMTLKLYALTCAVLLLATSGSAIPWMFQPMNEIHSLSNNYMELQNYGYNYYHDGIDVIKPSGGEPTYSVSDGYMTHESYGTMYGGLMIGDEYIAGDDGWLYWHLPSSTFQFNVGDRILEGDYIGDIATWSVYEFHHVHFNKVVGTGGLPWSWYQSTDNPLVLIEPNTDPQPPSIYNAVGSNLLAFCVDNTSSYLNPSNLSGNVDIISKIGDLIYNADWEVAPYKIEYSINGANIYHHQLGFLFEGILPPENTITSVVYKDDATCNSSGNYTERDFFFSVTNHDADSVVEATDNAGHWNTAGFPAGQYWVAVHTSDVGGNAVSDSMQVIVLDAPDYNVTVDLTPISSTQIPSSGGRVTYSVAINNYETSTVNFDAWLDLTYPGGSIEIVALRNLTVPAGGSIFRELAVTIAGSEPDGNYYFSGNVGYQPYNPWQTDGFDIQKGTNGLTGPWVDETIAAGWDQLCEDLENLPPEKCTLARVPYKVRLTGPKTLSELTALKLDVVRASVGDEPTVEVFLNPAEVSLLKSLGYRVEEMPYQAREMFLKLKNEPDGGNPMREYHSYDEIVSELQNIASANPDICLLHNAGTSEQGRVLWFMQISDNIGTQEDEPEVLYISTMHGDEPVGMEMCMYFINLLVDRYGIDPEINALVDDNELWIMPLMNPDGYVMGQRYNANGVDLNRNFPDRVDDPVNTTAGRAVETANVMNWSFDHQPILSANFHTGALVVNYVWDHSFDPQANAAYTDDQDLVLASAETYSFYNTPMWNNNFGSFNNGTVNGADWYQISGGMMDWNYHWMGDLDNTIELSNISWPGSGELPQYWEENRQSMIEYINFNHRGVRGIVRDVSTNLPLLAEIDVVGRDFTIYTDPDVGDYHRMLMPGVYDLEISSFGYWTADPFGIIVTEGDPTVYDVYLEPADQIDFSGTLHHPAGSGLSARLYLLDTPYDPVETDANGDFTFTNVYEGEYTLRINNLDDNSVIDIPMTLETGMTPLELWGPVAAFYDGFESGLGNWTAQGS